MLTDIPESLLQLILAYVCWEIYFQFVKTRLKASPLFMNILCPEIFASPIPDKENLLSV